MPAARWMVLEHACPSGAPKPTINQARHRSEGFLSQPGGVHGCTNSPDDWSSIQRDKQSQIKLKTLRHGEEAPWLLGWLSLDPVRVLAGQRKERSPDCCVSRSAGNHLSGGRAREPSSRSRWHAARRAKPQFCRVLDLRFFPIAPGH